MKNLLKITGFLMLALVACKKEDLPPKVYLPTGQSSITTNDTLVVDFTVTDDNLLTSAGYALKPLYDSVPGILRGWRKTDIAPVSGNTYFFSDSFPVPDSISAGSYTLHIFATDDGVLTDTLKDDFMISSKLDTLLPVLDSMIAPDSVLPGADISVNFTIHDDTRLSYSSYKLTSQLNDSLLVENDTILLGSDFTGAIELKDVGNFQRVRFELVFYDWVNNKVRKTTDIIIKEN